MGIANRTGFFAIVRNFLFGFINKEFLTFLFFLLLSGAFWLILALNEDCERELKIPVTLTGVPQKVVITSQASDTLRVTVRDKGYMLLPYVYGDMLRPLALSFKTFDKGSGHGQATQVEMARLIKPMLFKSTVIVSVKPERFEFSYNHGDSKRVPVRLRGTVTPDEAYYLSRIVFEPEFVTIYASRDKLDSVKSVYTEGIRITNLTDTVSHMLNLRHIQGVKIQPAQVKVSFYPDVLTEESREIPVTAINMPEGKILRTFPSKVKVVYTVGASAIRNISPGQFTVVADYNDILAHPSDKCPVKLTAKPSGLKNVKLELDEVNYLIEEQ